MPLDRADLLAVYDEQLRTDAETTGAVFVVRHGPLWLVTSGGGRGFVTYRDLAGADAGGVRALVAAAREHYRADPAVTRVEWKARGHDVAPGLVDALAEHGFAPGEEEVVVLGEARALDVDVLLPEDVSLRAVSHEADVHAATALQDEVFGDPASRAYVDDLLQRLATEEGTELWVAEVAGEVVGTGRLEPVAGSEVAGLWGGATLAAWRHRGVYRALTAERARSALRQGRTLLHSDCSPHSRPVLERAGLLAVTTTTPWTWHAAR
ncbi:GNAT family N-acetyltransferase [Pseudokineococcus basanitobsidens]|uniref:GNAT family N-acetyltransferase n=1 Tax=Pseudokineococcus basanitobsidens TaxID=1926649 RepID=A0ABU8RFR6_9ACTN